MADDQSPFGNKTQRYNTLDEWQSAEEKSGFDLKGYINKYGIPDQSKGQHLGEEFKMPHHITFSDKSKYHSTETPGGKWAEQDDTWHYYPSDFVMKQQGVEKLTDYFKTHEPKAVLHLPK